VFCGYVRTIGETLDVRRVPTPDEKRFAPIRAKLHDIGDWSATARIS